MKTENGFEFIHLSTLIREVDSPVWKATKENIQDNIMDAYSEVRVGMGADI